jgi:CelD/BcsL family acetyltransferase involved in cellulose biosynthesis
VEAIPAGLAVHEVTTAAGLEALRREWSALWDADPDAAPFQTPEWLLPWWAHLGGGELWTLALRDRAGLAGLAPLFVWQGGGARQVTLLGNGISDRLGLLAAPGRGREVAAAVLAHLAARASRWDTADLRDLAPDSPLLSVPLPPGLLAVVEEDEPGAVLALPGSVAELAASPAGKQLARLAYPRRRAGREGGLSAERAGGASLDAMLDDLFRLHGARWAGRGEPGVLAGEAVRRFHREAAAGLLARGLLRTYALRIGGRTAAVHHGFHARGRAWYYLGGFDPAFARLSPGHLAVAHAVEQAVREGMGEMDFLRGREGYKHEWGATPRPARRLRLRVAGARAAEPGAAALAERRGGGP